MRIVSFYTEDTPYEKEVQPWISAIEAVGGIEYTVYPVKNRGSWEANCSIKPEILLQAVKEYGPVLYIDIDGRLMRDPPTVPDHDIAVHYRMGRELLSGTLICSSVPLLEEWVARQQQNANQWDQKILQLLLTSGDYKVINLPAEWCKIFDKMDYVTDPIVLHTQASRRYKNMVTINRDVPDRIGNVRIRKLGDGTFFIARQKKDVVEYLDSRFQRIKNELRWAPKECAGKSLEDLLPIFKGRPCYVVGKGPSLDMIDSFPELWPVLCVNDSIHAIEKLNVPNPLFCIQQDMGLEDKCKPEKAGLIVAYKARLFYHDFGNKYIYQPSVFLNGAKTGITVCIAIEIAKYLGSTRFVFKAFDACMDGSTDYAGSIGYPATNGGSPNRFLKHRQRIERQIGDMPFVFE